MLPTLTLNAKEKPARDTVRVLIVPYGEWKGHPVGDQSYGPVECKAMVDYFNATTAANGKCMVIDYGHQVLQSFDAPAAGWIWSLELDEKADPPGIYGEVEWTERAASGIKANEYRYISPVIITGEKDTVTGEVVPIQLFTAALTNIPFMHDKMNAVTANMAKGAALFTNAITLTQYTTHTNTGGGMDPQKMMDGVKKELGLGADASPDDVLGFIKKLVEFMALAPGAPAEGAPVTPEALPGMEAEMKQAVANSKAFTDIVAALECKPEEAVRRVAVLNTKAGLQSDSAKELATLKAKVAQMEVAEFVNSNANRIPPARKDSIVALFGRDPEAARMVVAELPVIDAPHPTVDAKADETKVPDEVENSIRTALNTHQFYQKKEA